ncbi:hypothetical protein PR003_g9278 [Phytophthora rubi]|uniref:Uncharacterized protein n=1 Tax=Phytophthora rubi TaxID=129364 RepID=A0A6A4FGP9_9STRA|nr:hypothetical protein PR002_g8972 [Phytophthora rubi]KAE9038057.1 hypothetical protein PR001_g8133 [Phytophthora rubi]KAE9342831.1 hypothetical protein PR003_g9278 [Phytophthora rubi]
MARKSQSDRFQEPTQQLGGQYLYNAIRMQLKHAGGAAIWEASKDRPVLQANKAHLQKMNWVKMMRADYIDFIAMWRGDPAEK